MDASAISWNSYLFPNKQVSHLFEGPFGCMCSTSSHNETMNDPLPVLPTRKKKTPRVVVTVDIPVIDIEVQWGPSILQPFILRPSWL